jgi:hypothetical protein
VLLEPPAIDKKPQAAHTRIDLDRIVREIKQAAAEADVPALSSAEPIPCDLAARRRFSISRLAGTLDDAPAEGDPQQIWQPTGCLPDDAIELGILVHAVLATLDPEHTSNLESHVVLQADKLQVRNSATRDEALRLLKQYVDSPRARRLRQAQRTFREIEFLLALPPGKAQLPKRAYLQGFVDCLFQDATGLWHVIDYKTNQVSSRALPDLIAKYEMQMLAYGLAAEQALGEPIGGLTLHFLRTGEEHSYEWNDQTRDRAIALIHHAIEQATK